MRVSLVVAMTPDRVIGKDGGLPWRMPADLRYFRRLTLGHPVIMGRKTWDSIGGKPLDGRTNIVLTRREGFRASGCIVAHTPDDALRAAAVSVQADDPEVMVLGGAAIYAAFLPRADRLYVTFVHADVTGDTRFPPLDFDTWHEVERADHAADEKNPYAYSFSVFERRSAARS
ncbi:MAG: dihydrofolate reductase [Candidatus Latescibacterota bacterium]|nr:MAG: dihydrofolate reductase [Candidatus Latescibacterota bacterium]